MVTYHWNRFVLQCAHATFLNENITGPAKDRSFLKSDDRPLSRISWIFYSMACVSQKQGRNRDVLHSDQLPSVTIQITGSNLAGAPFNACQDNAGTFLRHIRGLRLHAFATMSLHAKPERQDAGNIDAGINVRDGSWGSGSATRDRTGADASGANSDVSQWQERRHTYKEVGYRNRLYGRKRRR